MKRTLLLIVMLTLSVSVGTLYNPPVAHAHGHYTLHDHLVPVSRPALLLLQLPQEPVACECIYGKGGVRVCGCAGSPDIACVPGGVPCRP